jgi:hypothetical protein
MHKRDAVLMRSIIAISAVLIGCAASAVTTAWWLDPMQHLNETQAAVMHEYLAAFCAKDDRHDKQFVIGTAATMSRIVVKGQPRKSGVRRICQVQDRNQLIAGNRHGR